MTYLLQIELEKLRRVAQNLQDELRAKQVELGQKNLVLEGQKVSGVAVLFDLAALHLLHRGIGFVTQKSRCLKYTAPRLKVACGTLNAKEGTR
jgi:hypothetical protein